MHLLWVHGTIVLYLLGVYLLELQVSSEQFWFRMLSSSKQEMPIL